MSLEVMGVEALTLYRRIPCWSVYRLAAAGRLAIARDSRHWRWHKVPVH